MNNPYLTALELVKQHHGTSGQVALAKGILSIYNPMHPFSIGEVLGPMDTHYTRVVLDMVRAYGDVGETEELRQAGKWVCEHFPGLLELSEAMRGARQDVRDRWEREREEEARRLYPDG